MTMYELNSAETSTKHTSNVLLEIKHISVDYYAASGNVHALNDVNITLERGQILGLVGESGSGKSTLAYAITRLLHPPAVITDGEILYYPRSDRDEQQPRKKVVHSWQQSATETEPPSVDILQLTPAQLRAFRWNELSIVFQSAMNALNPVMTIGTQIQDVLRTHRPKMGPDSRKQRALELLRLVGIAPDRIRSYPHELSGGMRQRAIIAIALALSPELIILDEPTTALDVVVQREILTEIMRLREQLGFSVIFITHDLSLLLEMADTIAVMYAGRVVEKATSQELRSRPCHPYSYGLLNSFPTIHGPRRRMTGIPGSPPDLRAIPSGCAFHPRCPCAFDACSSVFPALLPVSTGMDSRRVACHLYDSHLGDGEPPANEEFAARYEDKYEAMQKARSSNEQ
ncbi:MAG TPA: ABC transporter ATP-binding protein [Ktedonobacteraceae bacterium]|nr:ABC transporter ATP-binding protein [Ktedonobacteraceae bacterium]